jgi:hypothetical protein
MEIALVSALYRLYLFYTFRLIALTRRSIDCQIMVKRKGTTVSFSDGRFISSGALKFLRLFSEPVGNR